jgi:hypothetical protein
MKLKNYLAIIVLISIVQFTMQEKSNLKKKSLGRADMVKAENEYFQNLKFKEVSSGWGDLLDTVSKVDPFTGSVLNQTQQKLKSVANQASKKIKNAIKDFFGGNPSSKQDPNTNANTNANNNNNNNNYGHSNGASSAFGMSNQNYLNGIDYDKLNYGPLVRPNKVGIIYGDTNSPDSPTAKWTGAWNPNPSAGAAAGNAGLGAAIGAAGLANGISNGSATAGAASTGYHADVSAAAASVKTGADAVVASGMNGGKSLDFTAAGNTPVTDIHGNEVPGTSVAGKAQSIAQAAASAGSFAAGSGSASLSASGSASLSASASASLSASSSYSATAGAMSESYSMAEYSSPSSQGEYSKLFKCPKESILKSIDPRYKIIKLMENRVNDDNSIRFFCVDTTNDKTVSLKLFFKGIPHNCEFFNQLTDKDYSDASRDCLNNQIINNRLYKLPKEYKGSYTEYKGKEMFNDVIFPLCQTNNSYAGGDSFFHEVYELPEGESLKNKCLKEDKLDNTNTCIPYLRTITRGVLHGLEILNSGNKYYLHGNITPANLYLKVWTGEQKVYMDNIKFNSNTYDDVNNKPSTTDMDQLGDTLLQLLLGTEKLDAIKYPIRDAFDLYVKVKEYLRSTGKYLNIKTSALNVPSDIDSHNPKIVTKEEYLYKLSKSVFDMIYRLKNTNVEPNMQFTTPGQALKHDFLLQPVNIDASSSSSDVESLGSAPSDY